MLVECRKCGAPLDVQQDDRLTRCHYCQATTRVGHTRTLAAVTPAQWTPPLAWTPPPETGLPAQALAYQRTRKVVRGVMTMIIVFTVLGTLLPLTICVLASFWGATRGTPRPPAVAPAPPPMPTRWDGATPIVCSGNDRLVLEDVETPIGATPDVLVRVTHGNCVLTFRRVKLRGATLARVEGHAEIIFEDSSFVGNVFAHVEDGAELQIARSVVTVEQLVTRGARTKLTIRGPTEVRASRVIAELGEGAQVDIEGADVSLQSDGDGIGAEHNARMRLSGARIEARGGAAVRTGDAARLELDGATLVGKLDGLRVGRSARIAARQGSVTAEGAALRTGRSARIELVGTHVEGAVAFDLDDHATLELQGATLVGERRSGRNAMIRER